MSDRIWAKGGTAVIRVPVLLVINARNLRREVRDVLALDGKLSVRTCPSCYALVPERKLAAHRKAMNHRG